MKRPSQAARLNETCLCLQLAAHPQMPPEPGTPCAGKPREPYPGRPDDAQGSGPLAEGSDESPARARQTASKVGDSLLYSPHPLFVSQDDARAMARFVGLFHTVTQSQRFRSLVAPHLPGIARHDSGAVGVFDGYDFHLTADGPRLIEVNTNAGGLLLNHQHLSRHPLTLRQACCERQRLELPLTERSTDFERDIVDVFLQEHQRRGATSPPVNVAIIDDRPTQQFLYPEFLLFQDLLQRHGYPTVIADPHECQYREGHLFVGDVPIDLVYNRHTDFYLESPALEGLRQAYLDNAITLTPNPNAYGFRADKGLLILMSDASFLEELSLPREEREFLLRMIPKTRRLDRHSADELWQQRKRWFFKPLNGHGGKAVYSGQKITKGTWKTLLESPYVAQERVDPSRRIVSEHPDQPPLKADIRYYVYDGRILQRMARLYSGQTTNFRTPNGGFSPLVIVPE